MTNYVVKTNPETILLKGDPIFKEGRASAILKPGHLIEFGGSADVRKQSVAQADCRRAFALENDLVGKGTTSSYAANEIVRYASFHAGQEVLGVVAAAAPAIAKGDALEAKGDGTLRKLTSGGVVIGFALAAINNSAGRAEVFIPLEVA